MGHEILPENPKNLSRFANQVCQCLLYDKCTLHPSPSLHFLASRFLQYVIPMTHDPACTAFRCIALSRVSIVSPGDFACPLRLHVAPKFGWVAIYQPAYPTASAKSSAMQGSFLNDP